MDTRALTYFLNLFLYCASTDCEPSSGSNNPSTGTSYYSCVSQITFGRPSTCRINARSVSMVCIQSHESLSCHLPSLHSAFHTVFKGFIRLSAAGNRQMLEISTSAICAAPARRVNQWPHANKPRCNKIVLKVSLAAPSVIAWRWFNFFGENKCPCRIKIGYARGNSGINASLICMYFVVNFRFNFPQLIQLSTQIYYDQCA